MRMPLKTRKVSNELLDHLDAEDPEAIRSRKDLHKINLFMGNMRWIKKQIEQLTKLSESSLNVIEVGAGDGQFLESLIQNKNLNLTGIDIQPRPKSISNEVDWIQENVLEMETVPQKNSDPVAVICNLILHHFSDDQLFKLGQTLSTADHVIINEPSRRYLPLFMGYLAFPLLGKVTRHDMIVSIRAGFRNKELIRYFPSKNCLSMDETIRGSIRYVLS